MDIFYLRTPCKEQPSYVSGALRRRANTKITISVSLTCTCYSDLRSTSLRGRSFSAPTAIALLQGQRKNVRTHQSAFRICYVVFSGTEQSWHYAEYPYKQQRVRSWGQRAELRFTRACRKGCRQHAKPAVRASKNYQHLGFSLFHKRALWFGN